MSERDVEKEHQVQLRRWKETHGELRCRSPPRLHGARAIMAAEPPSRQHLQQQPTIVMGAPQPSSKPPALPEGEGEPHPILRETGLQGSRLSLSSSEQDTYL